MIYNQFGKSNENVSLIGIGGSSLPSDNEKAYNILKRAFELGVNYVDMGKWYVGGKGEEILGQAVKGVRDSVFISSKFAHWEGQGEKWFFLELERILLSMKLSYLDFFVFWDLHWEHSQKYMGKNEYYEAALKAKEIGLIRHIGFTSHDKPENIKRLIDTDIFDMLVVEYNLINMANESVISYANQKNMGVATLGTMAGGRFGGYSVALNYIIPGINCLPELALRFSISNTNVDMILAGVSKIEQLEENINITNEYRILSLEEKNKVIDCFRKLKIEAEQACSGCKCCVPCPNGVDVCKILSLITCFEIYKIEDYAKRKYQDLELKGKGVQACNKCGKCETKCPQGIRIREKIHKFLLNI